MEDKKRILAVGLNSIAAAKSLFGDIKVDGVDQFPDDVRKKGYYDAVLSYMSLCVGSYRIAQKTLLKYSKVLKEGGELHLFVPSLEWAADQILSEEPSKILLIHLFGEQTCGLDTYRSGFAMLDLRNLLPAVGIEVVAARAGEYTIGEYTAEMLYVSGIKKNVNSNNLNLTKSEET